MENLSLDRYDNIKAALKELGFKVEFIEKKTRKTVITVSHCEKGERSPVFAEEQEAKRDKDLWG